MVVVAQAYKRHKNNIKSYFIRGFWFLIMLLIIQNLKDTNGLISCLIMTFRAENK